jgi:hypothetical protein
MAKGPVPSIRKESSDPYPVGIVQSSCVHLCPAKCIISRVGTLIKILHLPHVTLMINNVIFRYFWQPERGI